MMVSWICGIDVVGKGNQRNDGPQGGEYVDRTWKERDLYRSKQSDLKCRSPCLGVPNSEVREGR